MIVHIYFYIYNLYNNNDIYFLLSGTISGTQLIIISDFKMDNRKNKIINLLCKSKYYASSSNSTQLTIAEGNYKVTIHSGGSGGGGSDNGLNTSHDGEQGGLSKVGNIIVHAPIPGSAGSSPMANGGNAHTCTDGAIFYEVSRKINSLNDIGSENIGGNAGYCKKVIESIFLSGSIEIIIGQGGKGGDGYGNINSNGVSGKDGVVIIEPL